MVFTLSGFDGSALMESVAAETHSPYEEIASVPKNVKSLVGMEENAGTQILASDDLYSLTTQEPDGTGKVETYTVPVRYLDEDGNAQLIDTSMKAKKKLFSLFGNGYDYENGANGFKVEYSRSPQKGMRVDEIFTMAPLVEDGQNAIGSASQQEDGAGKLIYPAVFGPGTTVEYVNTNRGVKENIILSTPAKTNTFDFVFKSSTHTLVLVNNGAMAYVVPKDDPDTIDYVFSTLYAYDSHQANLTEDTNTPAPEGDPPVTSAAATSTATQTESSETTLSSITTASGTESEELDTTSALNDPTTVQSSEKSDTASSYETTETTSGETGTTPPQFAEPSDADEATTMSGQTAEGDESTVPSETEATTGESVESSGSSETTGTPTTTTPIPEPADPPAAGIRHYTEDCHYELVEQEDGSILVTVVVSDDFLNQKGLEYPITIDPSFNCSSSASNIDDTYICGGANEKNSNYYLADNIRIGNYNGGRCYGFIHFLSLASAPSGSTVTGGTLTLTFRSGQTSGDRGRVQRITESWQGKNVTYASWFSTGVPRHAPGDGFLSNTPLNFNTYVFQMDPIVKNWYNGTWANYGVMLKYEDITLNDYNSLCSSDCGEVARAPKLTVNYTAALMPPASGIYSGREYYIRSQYSGKYITMTGTDAQEREVVQNEYLGTANQRWTVTYNTNTTIIGGGGYYVISSALNSNLKLFAVGNSTNGYALKAKMDGGFYPMTYFRLLDSGNGTYRIQEKGSNHKVVDVRGPSLNNGAAIQLWDYVNVPQQRWYFELAVDAKTGKYVDACPLDNQPGRGYIDDQLRCWRAGGYNTIEYRTTAATSLSEIKNSMLTVIHGHGNVGLIQFTNPYWDTHYLYSSRLSSGSGNSTMASLNSYDLRKNKLIIFTVCYSGAAATGGVSFIDQAINCGAKCAIGYRNTVANGEEYSKMLFNRWSVGSSLNSAITYADYDYLQKYGNMGETSPANKDTNRITRGDTSIIF